MINPPDMEPLSVYIPIDRRQALAKGSVLPDRAEGAVLFADISGFTALTDTLTNELGPRLGAEETSRQLNHMYQALIAEVDRYGGSVIEFGGDAITCWYDGDTGLRAAATAAAMQAAMRTFATLRTPAGAAIEFAIKVCAVTGPVRRFLVGDPDIRSIEVLAGHTLERINVAAQLVQKGEVLLSGAIVDAAGSRLRVAEWRSDPSTGERFAVIARLTEPVPEQPWPRDSPIPDEVARAWILLPVYERLREGAEQFLAELRPVVAFFLRFTGIDYDGDDGAGQKIDAYIRWVQRVIDRYEGVLLQLNMGDKGSYLYATFGAPIAHENDSDRAVAAALDLRAPPPELNYIRDVCIGLSRGEMRTGAYGGPTRRGYGVLGSDVNVAARLMEMAQAGQVLVTERMAHTAPQFEFREFRRASLKGLSHSLVVYDVQGRRREQPDRPSSLSMVGRVAERRAIAGRLDRLARDHAGGVVVVEGDAGLGKSRLLAEAMDQALGQGLRILTAAGDAIERATPYFGWRSILNQALGLTGVADASSRAERVMGYLSQDAHLLPWAPLLSEVLQLDLPPNEVTRQMSRLVQADDLQELLATLVTLSLRNGEAAAPVVLVLDDAHWLDSSSWALLRIVVERNPAVLALIATRPMNAPIPAEYAQLIERDGSDYLRLDVLPPAEVDALVCERLGAVHLPPAVSEFIRERAEGNPFFSEELALALRDGRLIEIRDGVCTLAPGVQDLRSLDVPTTIQGIITSRVDRLPSQQQLTLKVASIIGRIFTYYILQDVHPLGAERQHVREHLDGLTRLDITHLYRPEPELAYMFKHIVTQEVVYNLMLSTQQQQLHRAVAEWYEREYAADRSPYYSLLAYHWQRAAESPQAPLLIRFKAIDYLDLAGDQALRSSAYKEAIDFFEKAMALEPAAEHPAPGHGARSGRLPSDVRRRAQRFQKLGEALRNWGRASDSRAVLEQAAVLYGHPVPASTRKAVLGLSSQLAQQILHRLNPARYVGRATPVEEAVLMETARAYMFISEIFFFTNEVLLSLYGAVLSLNLSETAGASAQLASTYGGMGLILGTAGLHRWAGAYHRMAIETARATGQPIAMALALRATGLYYVELGRWNEAEETLKTCIDIAGDLGDKRDWGDLVSMLAGVHAFRGDIPRALELLASIAGPRSGSLIHRTLSALWRGGFTLRLGRFDEAIQLLKSALDLTADATDAVTMVHSKINAWAYLAAAYLRQGRFALAREAADKAWQMVAATKPGAFHLGTAFEYVAETYLALIRAGVVPSGAERQQMVNAARTLTRNLLRTSSPTTKMRGWHCEGLLRVQAGQLKQAHRWWAMYQAAAERLEMPFEHGIAHYEIGRHLPVGDPARERHLERAIQLFEQIGAVHERAQAEKALAPAITPPTEGS